MDATANVLARLGRFARRMNPELPPVDMALGAVRALIDDAGIGFKFVGGVAVVHHGYARTTEDIDVLVESGAPARLRAALRPALAGLRRDALEEIADGDGRT